MSWNEERSRHRIAKLLATVPVAGITVEDFASQYRPRRLVEAAIGQSPNGGQPIAQIPYDAVVTTHGAHVYANLVDYDAYLEEIGRETEAGCALLLEFVHLHYSGMDRLIEAFGAQRVDHHGGRVHAVILEPVGDEGEAERIDTALSLAAAMRSLVAEASAAHQRRFGTRIRVGVESGPALAINGGRGTEPEPLFIGDAANVAAKLADGEEEGVAIGPRARGVLSVAKKGHISTAGMLLDEASRIGESMRAVEQGVAGSSGSVTEAFDQFRTVELATAGTGSAFVFHRHSIPLETIVFDELSPSRSVRQEMASLFADLSGFTAYVHRAMATGEVSQVVSNLHVLRGEMAAVIRDFGGRKIRFIGDCVHGVMAEGTRAATDEMDTVRKAVSCAGAIRSSFELCQRVLPAIGELGLTIGIEIGATPITRLGIRGTRSVRCSSSKAVTVSENVQRSCDSNETALGPNARAKAPSSIRQAFGTAGVLGGLDYIGAAAFAAALAAPAIARAEEAPAQSYSTR